MKITKELGIWMDHSTANLMEFTVEPINTKTVVSNFTREEKGESFPKSEKKMHNKENQEHLAYYQELAGIISNYTDVLLFGPTNAKTELLNFVRRDHNEEKVNISIRDTDKLTTNQQHAYVREYFSQLKV